MRRTFLGLALIGGVAFSLTGCEPKPSVQIAPDVKEPNTSGMSTEEVLRLKNGQGANTSDSASNVAPR